MRGVNTVFIVGRAGQDPEIRTSKAGRPWLSLPVATHRNVRGEDGEWVEETDWHDIRVFGEQAEHTQQMVAKGCKVAVEGVLSYDLWTDDEGVKRRSTRILANQLRVVGAPRAEAVIALAEASPAAPAPEAPEAASPAAEAAAPPAAA